jgi:hypothetical protein
VRESDTVNTLRVRDIAKDLACGIDDHDVSSARDEDALALGVKADVVPAAIAGQVDLVLEFIS